MNTFFSQRYRQAAGAIEHVVDMLNRMRVSCTIETPPELKQHIEELVQEVEYSITKLNAEFEEIYKSNEALLFELVNKGESEENFIDGRKQFQKKQQHAKDLLGKIVDLQNRHLKLQTELATF